MSKKSSRAALKAAAESMPVDRSAPAVDAPNASSLAVEPMAKIGERQPPVDRPLPSRELHVFPNPHAERDYTIQFQIPEFTCNCPLTGQPDFAHFTIDMVADELCIELKSLKMYMWSYRNDGAFHEKVTNDILDDIVRATDPRYARIVGKWFVRGGIYTNIVAEHRKKGWKPQPAVALPAHEMERGLLG
jgi:7-cyano-7-deazaguanine reductase